MSAFMCSKETIWDIASYICIDFPEKARTVFNVDPKSTGFVPAVYKELVDLNIEALAARYGKDCILDMVGDVDDYYSYTAPLGGESGFPLHKRMSCFLYQCYEGNVSDSKEYELVERAHYQMCSDLLSTLENDYGDYSEYWN